MKRLAGAPRVLALSLVILMSTTLPAARAATDPSVEIGNVLRDKLLARAQAGINIVRLNTTPTDSQVIYHHTSDLPLVPASNLKLITTSAALEALGADFKFRTQLVWHDNDLILIGDGDPTLGDVELLKQVGWDVNTVFKNWAEQLKKFNVTSARNVIVDDSIFDQQFIHSAWPADQLLKRYVAEVGGVSLNANCADFQVQVTGRGTPVSYVIDPPTDYVHVQNTCVGGNENAVWLSRLLGTNDIVLRGESRESTQVPVSVTIHDPPMFAATVLAETLRAGGISLSGTVSRDLTIRDKIAAARKAGDKSWVVLAIHETPLSVVLARANKDSMNLYAESLCKRVGAATSGQSGSWTNGTAAVGAFLKSLGVGNAEFHLDDGCGLSKQNNISASAISHVLAHNFFGPNRRAFIDSLAVAGVDGTLNDRFRDDPALRGRVFGKSGFVNGVSSLSGYLHARDDNWYAFSILLNGIPSQSNTAVKVLKDRIVEAVDKSVDPAGKLSRAE